MAARTLQQLVAAAASLHPDRAAVTYDGGAASGSPAVSLLYRELVQLAGELSLILRKNCSPNNGVIGLCCGDDLFIPVWILGWVHCSHKQINTACVCGISNFQCHIKWVMLIVCVVWRSVPCCLPGSCSHLLLMSHWTQKLQDSSQPESWPGVTSSTVLWRLTSCR